MATNNPLVAIFNPITTLIDAVQSVSISPGPLVTGTIPPPIVVNAQGLIDPTLLGTALSALAGEALSGGRLVNLYSVGGQLFAQNAWAAVQASPTSPSGSTYPIAAVGFLNSGGLTNSTVFVQFSGVMTYIDPNSEFSSSSIGAEVYLTARTPYSANAGGITLTRPSGIGQIQQTVGTVVGFTAPNTVQVAFTPTPQPPLLNFSNISTGTNTAATMTVGTGATLTFTGSGIVNANELTGDPVNTSGRTTGQALVWNGTDWAPSNTAATSFSAITSGTNTTATMTVGSGASIVVTGSGAITATALATTGASVTVSSAAPPTTGQVLTATSATTANWQTPSGGSGSPGGTPTQIQYNLASAFAGITGSAVGTHGEVTFAPTSAATQAALTVNSDTGGTNDIADFHSPTGSYNVVAISQPGFGTAAISVIGDTSVSDLQDWFLNGSGSPFLSVTGQQVVAHNVQESSSFLNQTYESRLVNITNTGTPGFVDVTGSSISLFYNGNSGQTPTFGDITGLLVETISTDVTPDTLNAILGASITGQAGGGGGSNGSVTTSVIGAEIGAGFTTTGTCPLIEGLVITTGGNLQAGHVTQANYLDLLPQGSMVNFVGMTALNGILIGDIASLAPSSAVSKAINISSQTGSTNFAIYVNPGSGNTSYFGGNISVQAELIDSAASPGTAGQRLTSTGTQVLWANAVQNKRFLVSGTVAAGSFNGPYTVNFTTPFADNNYTVEVTAVVGEAMSTAPCFIGGVQQNGTGTGVLVWVTNNDSIAHTVTINVYAEHD